MVRVVFLHVAFAWSGQCGKVKKKRSHLDLNTTCHNSVIYVFLFWFPGVVSTTTSKTKSRITVSLYLEKLVNL